MAMTSMQTISPSPTVTPSDENGPSSTRTLPINAIIVLSLVAAIIGTTSITSIIIAVVLTRKARSRKRVGSIGGTSEQRSHELDAYTPIRPQPEQARYDRERTMFLQYSSRGGNEENNTVTGEISMDSMELPQPFDAISIIDDVELPNDDSQMNSNGVPC